MDKEKYYSKDRTKEMTSFTFKKMWAASVIEGPECFEDNEDMLRMQAIDEDGIMLSHRITHKVINGMVLFSEIDIFRNNLVMDEMINLGMRQRDKIIDLGLTNN